MKEKFRVFAKNARNLYDLILRVKYLSRMKLLTVVMEFDRELSYLSWVFDKKLKGFKGPNSKGFKYYDAIYRKLQGLSDDREAMKSKGVSNPPLRVVEYSKFAHASYMLDYTIWAYLRNGKYLK